MKDNTNRRIKIEAATDYFLTSLEAKGRSPRTLRWYRNYLSRWLEFEPAGAVEAIDEVTPELMDAWAVSLQRPRVLYENHGYREDEKGVYSKHTIAGLIRAVKTFFKFCCDRGYIERDPAAHLRQPNLSHQGRNKAMNMEDFRAMYEAAQALAMECGNPRDLAIFSFMADTAARRGEVSGLQLEDLDLDNLVATVDGKTGPRPVEFTSQTAEILRLWLRFRRELPPAGEHSFVFVGVSLHHRASFGRPLLPQAINQIFRRLAKKAGVHSGYNPHAIRHLVGKAWVDAGVNLELVRLKLGHSDVGVTARFYANQDRARVQAMTEAHSLLNGGNGHAHS